MPTIEYTTRFERALKKKTKRMKDRIRKTLELLGQDPWYSGLETHKIKGTEGVLESYVNKANRVTWEWGSEPGTILLRNNCTHEMPSRSP